MGPVEWQPITGCSYASPGCKNCKTMKLASAAMRAEIVRDGLVKESNARLAWTGAVRFSETRLMLPAETPAPTEFVVCPHSDLFHENVQDAWVDRVFEQIEQCQNHAFHIVTKRAARLHSYVARRYGSSTPQRLLAFGVSCERQIEADERIPLLQKTPASRRVLTLFPLLGPIDLSRHLAGISAVMVGQERERSADPSWVRSIAEQCRAARVPFAFSDRLVGQV
ncbi:MAG: hypothetical protein JWP25_7274 [Bradyrhizobium sp.]|nr:hypothetical protein [Bradyrhizobium sp.]